MQTAAPHASESPIAYTEVHGLKLFRCKPYSVTLSTKACGARHLEAREATGRDAERILHCRSCPIGALHAGQEQLHFSFWYDKPICPRCHKTWLRLIGNCRCVSCYNRERELASGRNAKGKVPYGVKPIHDIAFTYMRDGEVCRYSGRAVDRSESILQLLRTKRGRLTFAFSADNSNIRQGRLL